MATTTIAAILLLCSVFLTFPTVHSLAFPSSPFSSVQRTNQQQKSFSFQGYTTTFEQRIKNHVDTTAIVFLHPIGIGMSNWFWDPQLLELANRYSLYAPNLLGCGVSRGSDPYTIEADDEDIYIPWIEQVEEFLQSVVLNNNKLPFLQQRKQRIALVCQGGVAPLAIQLADRNPTVISHIVLSSPPPLAELQATLDPQEIRRNYSFLSSRLWGDRAFALLLEQPWAIAFFSNLFLCETPCDDTWIQNAVREMGILVRPPVQYFNAGYCERDSLTQALERVDHIPLLIVQGSADPRSKGRFIPYTSNCQVVTIPGTKSVVPWEAPQEFSKAVQVFLEETT